MAFSPTDRKKGQFLKEVLFPFNNCKAKHAFKQMGVICEFLVVVAQHDVHPASWSKVALEILQEAKDNAVVYQVLVKRG